MIEVDQLTKRYGRTLAVDRLSFQVRPGQVTGFLGPNGAGKSTTMRAVLGLDVPTSGRALVNGRPYATIRRPLHEAGALLDPDEIHRGRKALPHLRALALANGIGGGRVTEALELVGLAGVARKRVGGYSLGMKQRLGIAGALLGDPGVLLFDEPLNGLDPDGIRWIRGLLRSLAAEGRTVLVSSHLMSEMALVADHAVVIGRGRLLVDSPMRELLERFHRAVLVRAAEAARLTGPLEAAGATVSSATGEDPASLQVTGLAAREVGAIAHAHGVALEELTQRNASLEDAFLELTEQSVEFGARR
ncbi:MAG: ATP-binding cassette domain-containing protein [Streptosporangiales bacterium]|nr:ATP-binding cassette domain-containing protein [Streptosporangiales bacterium]